MEFLGKSYVLFNELGRFGKSKEQVMPTKRRRSATEEYLVFVFLGYRSLHKKAGLSAHLWLLGQKGKTRGCQLGGGLKPKNFSSLSKPLFNSCHTGPHILLRKLGYQSLPNLGKSHYIQSSWFFFERVLLSKKEQHGQVDRTFCHVFYTKSSILAGSIILGG